MKSLAIEPIQLAERSAQRRSNSASAVRSACRAASTAKPAHEVIAKQDWSLGLAADRVPKDLSALKEDC